MDTHFDVIIVGGSHAGLSAAMTLGRALRKVLVIDSGKPCNRQAPRSHNFITQDGEAPAAIVAKAKQQVLYYKTVHLMNDKVETVQRSAAQRNAAQRNAAQRSAATKQNNEFVIYTTSGAQFAAQKLLFATGITDIMPKISGFAACWGISVIHCPYCHGYEVRNQKTGILANGDMGFEFSRLISHWTKDLTLLTNGKSTLTAEQIQKMKENKINIVETDIQSINHEAGQIKSVILRDGTSHRLSALYARVPFEQHCNIPQMLGCALTESGYLLVDDFQQTSVPGIFAAGDNTTHLRSVSESVAAGTKAGAFINHILINENF